MPPPQTATLYRYRELESAATPYDVLAPEPQTVPLVFASPHSGRVYPPEFAASSRLDALTLRRSEDAFIDEVFGAAPALGAPLLRAHFPRAYVDPNREPWELDPAMFDGLLPEYCNIGSPRVAAGLGTIARVVTSGEEIYARKLRFEDAKARIDTCYAPYHEELKHLIEETRRRFGVCVVIDCHSMPSVGGPMDADPGLKRVDAVLGDAHGTACAGIVTETAERALKALGLNATRNMPYAGGFTTRHYGRPASGVHVLQIEVNRALYMDERTVARAEGLSKLAQKMARLIEFLVRIEPRVLAAA